MNKIIPFPNPNNPIHLSKAFYFFYFGAVGALLPFLTLYYDGLGLSGQQIGLLTGLSPIVTLISASLWGGLADATQQHRRILMMALVGVMITTLIFSVVTQFYGLIFLVVLLGFFAAPIMPLVDNTVLDILGDQTSRYGRIRLWGAIGFGLTPPIMGYFVEGFGIRYAFFSYLLLMLFCLLVFRLFPLRVLSPSLSDQPAFWARMRSLLQSKAWFFLLGAIFIGSMSEAAILNFLFLYMRSVGSGETLMGISLSVAMAGELVVFSLSGWLLRRWDTRQLLIIAMTGHGIRLLLYSMITTPLLILPVQLLHGFSFALNWIAAVDYAKKLAPPGLGATAQGILNSVKFGLGFAIGSYLAGILYQQLGPFDMFFWSGLWVFGAVILLLMMPKEAQVQVGAP